MIGAFLKPSFENDSMKTYFNTTDLVHPELASREKDAQSQEEHILRFFRRYPSQSFTPFEVQERNGMSCINSVRRAITNLTNQGKLLKTSEKRKSGPFNQTNCCWIAVAQFTQKQLF